MNIQFNAIRFAFLLCAVVSFGMPCFAQPKLLMQTHNEEGLVFYAEFSPDSSKIMYPSLSVNVIDALTGNLIVKYDDSEERVAPDFCSWSPDGRLGVFGATPYLVYVWDTATGQRIHKFSTSDIVQPVGTDAVKFFPDGQKIVASSNNALHVWNVDTGAKIQEIKNHVAGQLNLYPLSDNETIFNGREYLSIASGDVLMSLDEESNAFMTSNEKNLVLYSYNRSAGQYQFQNLDKSTDEIVNAINPISMRFRGYYFATSPDGSLLVFPPEIAEHSNDALNLGVIFDLRTGNRLAELNVDGYQPSDYGVVNFSADGQKLLVTNNDRIFVFDISDLSSSASDAKSMQ